MTTMSAADWYTGLTTLEMIYGVQRELKVKRGDYNVFTKNEIIRALNQSAQMFAEETRCIQCPVIVILAATQQLYKLPVSTLKVLCARYYRGDAATDYDELTIVEDAGRMQAIDSTMRGTPGDPQYLFASYSMGNQIEVGVCPVPTSAGTSYDPSTYGVLKIDSSGTESYTLQLPAGTTAQILGKTGNVMLDVARKPVPLLATTETAISEIPAGYHYAIISGAVAVLGGPDSAGKSFESEILRYTSKTVIEPTESAVQYYDYFS